MAADIEHIFQDFILNKIREIEDQSGDAGHSNEGGSNVGDNVSEKVDKDQDDAVGSHKKHKKHKKHKSKKKKKNKEEKESSSESGVESEGGTTRPLTSGGQEELANKEQDSRKAEDDDQGHAERHKKHSGKKKKKKKKKKKRRNDANKSSSASVSEAESRPTDAKGPRSGDREGRGGGSSRRTQDLPDIIPKQDSTKKSGDTERDGRRRRRSRSRSERRSYRSRSRNRSRRSASRSRSRSRRRRSRSRSRSERRLRKTRSRSPRRRSRTRSRSRGRRSTSREKGSEKSQATENALAPSLPPPPPPPPLVQVSPSDPPPKEQTVAAPPAALASVPDPVVDVPRSVGGWKPVPFLGVSSGKKVEPAAGSGQPPERPPSPPKCPTPAEVPTTESEMAAVRDSQRETPAPQNVHQASEKPPEGPAESSSGRPAEPSARSASPGTGETAEERQHGAADRSASPPKKRREPGSLKKRSEGKSSSKKKRRSKSPSRKKKSKSRSPARRKRSRSRSPARRARRSRSRSGSRRRRGPYGGALSQRDRWKREPSHSPVLILRKNRSPARKHHCESASPSRITELDKGQLLEIAKANAATMCAKAGVPIPESLRPSALSAMCLPMSLPALAMNAAMASMTAATMTAALSSMGALASMPPLPSITNKPPPSVPQANMAAMEEVKRKVAKQVNSISIKEFTDKCKKIVEKGGELAVAKPHVSDDEDDGRPFGSSALKEHKAISFSLNNMSVRPAARSDAAYAKEFPVSSGSQHRKKEGEGAYGEWVAVDKKEEKAKALAAAAAAPVPKATETPALPPAPPVAKQDAATALPSDSVFPDPPQEPVDIGQAVIERIKAQRRLAENPYDLNAICMLSHAQEQVDAWAQSNTIPGLFTGSTGAQVLTSEELSTGGPQAWLKKDQFLRAAPVSGGVGEFLMRKMGWRSGEGLGRNREGTVEPIIIDFKIDRKGLVAEGEKPLKQTGGLVVTKDLLGKHPVSALMELCVKKRWIQPDFIMVHHSGPDHRKNFLFKVVVNGADYQPPSASPNKKLAKAMAATVALQAMGEVPTDGPGLYTGPVFTAASTGPLFST